MECNGVVHQSPMWPIDLCAAAIANAAQSHHESQHRDSSRTIEASRFLLITIERGNRSSPTLEHAIRAGVQAAMNWPTLELF
jgi:hypothetical protein